MLVLQVEGLTSEDSLVGFLMRFQLVLIGYLPPNQTYIWIQILPQSFTLNTFKMKMI